MTVLPSVSLARASCKLAETAAARGELARTVASGSDVNPLRNRRRSDRVSPPETPRSFAEKSRYDPYRILPAEFTETKRSVREGSSVGANAHAVLASPALMHWRAGLTSVNHATAKRLQHVGSHGFGRGRDDVQDSKCRPLNRFPNCLYVKRPTFCSSRPSTMR